MGCVRCLVLHQPNNDSINQDLLNSVGAEFCFLSFVMIGWRSGSGVGGGREGERGGIGKRNIDFQGITPVSFHHY